MAHFPIDDEPVAIVRTPGRRLVERCIANGVYPWVDARHLCFTTDLRGRKRLERPRRLHRSPHAIGLAVICECEPYCVFPGPDAPAWEHARIPKVVLIDGGTVLVEDWLHVNIWIGQCRRCGRIYWA